MRTSSQGQAAVHHRRLGHGPDQPHARQPRSRCSQKELKTVKGVGKVVAAHLVHRPALTTQLQQAHSLIQQHVSFIVAEPLVPQPFIPIAAAAKAAGIPFISIFNATPSPDAINIAPNSVGDALTSGAQLAKMIGGKGVVLGVHGIPSTGVDQESFAGWKHGVRPCPGITLRQLDRRATSSPRSPRRRCSAYLISHPQPVAGVVQTAGMTSGIIQAFQQTGRPLPVFVDAGPVGGRGRGLQDPHRASWFRRSRSPRRVSSPRRRTRSRS